MLGMLKGFIASKKAAAMVAGILMSAFGKKVGLDESAVTSIVATIIAYIVGQGVADMNKEAAKIKEGA
jgi:hypothetical protein